MWEGYRLSYEESSWGSSTSCFESIKAYSINSRRRHSWYPCGMRKVSAIYSLRKVYKQIASGYASTPVWLCNGFDCTRRNHL